MLTSRELLLLEIGAETIDECFALIAASQGAQPDDALSSIRTTAWNEALRIDDSGTIRRRILKEGWDLDSLRQAVRKLPGRTIGHGWTSSLNWLLNSVQCKSRNIGDVPRSKHPFDDLLRPLCTAAWLCLRRRSKHACLVRLQEAILARLCTYAAPSLYEEFAKFRERSRAAASTSTAGDVTYHSFISDMRDGLFSEFLLCRPALARLLVSLVMDWVAATDEFLGRLETDQQSLFELTGSHQCSVNDLATIQSHLSDPHNGGRTVLLLTFSSGVRVLYKPRPLAFDVVWNRVTTWLSAHGGPSLASQPATLDMGQYGWQTFCDHTPCSQEAAPLYYERIGASLALFRALGSSDMHHENLIASGDQPVFVDVETLIAPSPRSDLLDHPAIWAAKEALTNSVFRSGVLPDAMLLPTGDVMTYGGLAESPGVSGMVWDFTDINTDRMRFIPVERRKYTLPNLPEGDRGIFSPSRYVSNIKAGYDKALTQLNRHWLEFWSPLGPLAGMSAAPMRSIFRPTATYIALLHLLRDPRRLSSGILWSSRLELDQGDGRGRGSLASPALLLAERRALVRADIPYFFTTMGQTTVWDGSGAAVPEAVEFTKQCEAVPPMFGSEDIDKDHRLIDWSLATACIKTPTQWPPPNAAITRGTFDRLLEAEAGAILDMLRRRAVIADGGVAWWGRKSLLKAPSIGVLGPSLYDGLSGIAIFLAAAACVLRDDSARDMTERAVTTVQSLIKSHRPTGLRPGRTLGMAFGMGGISYALATVSRLLGEAKSLVAARSAAAWITPDVIQADPTFDIMDGVAGAMIALLRLWEDTGEERWLSLAALCGAHILKAQRRGLLWGDAAKRPIQTGVAHGLAGIGFALCRLSRLSGKEEFGELGLSALQFIDRAYDESQLDWSSEMPEGPTEGERKFWCRWCHGALGVGLAWREQRRDDTADSESAAFVARATRGALKNPVRPVDTICCGNFGNVDYLLEVAGEDEALLSIAQSRVAWLIGERRRREMFAYDSADDEANLGLFPGVTGIGYVLLRTLVPARLPSLLAFH